MLRMLVTELLPLKTQVEHLSRNIRQSPGTVRSVISARRLLFPQESVPVQYGASIEARAVYLFQQQLPPLLATSETNFAWSSCPSLILTP